MKKLFFYFVSFCPILFFGQATTTGVNLSTEGTTWKVLLVEEPSIDLSGTGQLSVSGCLQTPDARLKCRIDVTHYKPALLEEAKKYLNTPGNYGFLYFINDVLTPAERTLYFDYKTSTTLSDQEIVKPVIPLTYTITQGIVLFEVFKACTFAGNSTTDASYAGLNLTCNNNKRYYYDGDNDGFGNPDLLKSAFFCEKPSEHYVTNFDDCDDSTSLIGKKKTWYIDHDDDGYGSGSYYSAILPYGVSRTIESCDKPSPYLGYSYADNFTDYDDENPSHIPSNVIAYYPDSDGDGYGFIYGPSISGYLAPDGYVANNLDCDDHDSYITAIFWGIDVNSDGVINDLDGSIKSQCTSPGSTYSLVNDPNNNWTHSVSYDVLGNITGIARNYFDDLGKPNVSLSKDMVQKKIWGTETTYDDFGRPDKSSFIAPTTLSTFEKTNFFIASNQTSKPPIIQVSKITSSQNYTASNTITASGAVSTGLIVNLSAPHIILSNGFSVPQGSNLTAKSTAAVGSTVPLPAPNLAGYYSDSNTDEPYQATASQPYSQTNYDTLNPGNVINVVGGNKINGDWKTGYSYTVPAAQEMYYVYGSDYYEGPMTSSGEEVITKFYKTVSVDANGVENVAFTDGEGKVLATARSGGDVSYPVVSLIGTQGFVDVHIPAGISDSDIELLGPHYSSYNTHTGELTPIPVSHFFNIYDLQTGQLTTSLRGGHGYRLEPTLHQYKDPKTYIQAGTINYVQAGWSLSEPIFGLAYRVNYYDYAVNVYNKTGQLVKSIQPKGFKLKDPIEIESTPPTYLNSPEFTTTYSYNDQGQIEAVNSPDEGFSQFAYRQDGQIRYSQSAKQAVSSEISYTNYDSYARPIESGVLTGATWTEALAGVDNDELITGTLSERILSERTFTVYDDPENTTTIKTEQIISLYSLTIPSNLSLETLAPSYIQNNLSGNVAVTYKSDSGTTINAITWYSYDIYGRSEWMVQYNEGIGTKTIHYEYDYKGNVKRVIYQKDNTDELFAHQYTYDANDVLKKVQTSTDLVNIGTAQENATFITQADYCYYLTGELKRVNIAEGLQGLDYVYTLGGQLKSINHPSLDPAKDPGGDDNDVFGITLDYYGGDYLRTDRNITSSPSIAPDYNGNILAARWANKGKAQDFTGSAFKQNSYLYNYDRNNFLTDATYGTADPNTAVITDTENFGERNINYDANGNIQTLKRTNDIGATVDSLAYNYAGKNQLTSINDAVTTTDPNDIEDQPDGNYVYNKIGQLQQNISENLFYIYNTQGLVTEVRNFITDKALVKFFYNERGQRIKKESYETSGTGVLQNTTFYILDLSGNTMAVYAKSEGSSAITQIDLPIYGLSRLGVYNRPSGISSYEITDHLGNVRAVVQRENDNLAIKSFADYYPFGELLPERNSLNYRYAFQGQELDTETNMEAFQLRLWDGRIGRWLSPDPYGQYDSPYLGMGNNPISMIDPDGGQTIDPPVNGGELKEVVIQGRPKSFKLDMSFDRKFSGFNFSFDDSWKRVGNNFNVSNSNLGNIDSVLSSSDWISQFTQPRPNVACKRTCDLIAGPSPIGRAINVARESGNQIVPTGNFDRGITTIDNYLKGGKPITVGVHHKFNAGYNEGTTDHYIVIVGRGTTNGQIYYRFYDVATRHRNLGTSPLNRLYLNGNSATGNTQYTNRRTYTLTQVRPN